MVHQFLDVIGVQSVFFLASFLTFLNFLLLYKFDETPLKPQEDNKTANREGRITPDVINTSVLSETQG